MIWDKPGNPPNWVAERLGIDRRAFGKRLHKIKGGGDFSGPERVKICDDGTVLDERDEPLGNLYDEDTPGG